MSLWKTVALDKIRESGHNPDTKRWESVRAADSPMMLWIELYWSFWKAHVDPVDEPLIRKIYEYAIWCLKDAPRGEDAGNDPSTAAWVAFLEHLPTEPRVATLAPKFLSRSDAEGFKDAFRYLVSQDEWSMFMAQWQNDTSHDSRRSSRKHA